MQNYEGISYINQGGAITPVTTTSTTTITNDGKVVYKGSTANAPSIESNADGTFSGLLNIPETSSPAAEFTNYQTLTTNGKQISLPESLQDGHIIETGTWALNPDGSGGYIFTPSSYQFSNYGTSVTLQNPTIQQLENYGISAAQAAQMLQGLSGSLDLTISASSGSSPGYSINAIPASGSTQLINVPIPTVNGKSTGGVSFSLTGNPTYIPTPTLPILYSYGSNGVATPTGFQGANGQLSNTYTTTINGTSYTFIIDNGNIEYAPTGSQAFAQLEFNANPNPQNAINLVNFAANQGEQEYSQNNALNQAYPPQSSATNTAQVLGTTLSQPQDMGAFSSESIAPGSIPIAISTPGGAGQYNSQFVGLPLASSNVGIGTAAMLPNSTQYTNTNQASSFTSY